MKTWARCWIGLVLVGALAASVSGQVPAVPGGAAAPAAAGAAAGQAPAAAGKMHGLKTFFAGCKEKFCASPFGNLVTNTMQPISALTGGILGNCCPPGPKAEDLAKPPTSAEGAAARIKQDEAQAKARREAVKYLGTVDCHYWPEAEAGLINALRADRNECVRLEAAWALGRGCCCTKAILKALTITVSCGDSDGFPSETSERVKSAAQFALDMCLARLCVRFEEAAPVTTETEKLREGPRKEKSGEGTSDKEDDKKKKDGDMDKAASLFPPYYQRVQTRPMKELIDEARKALEQSHAAPLLVAGGRDRPRSVSEIISSAFGDTVVDKAPGYKALPMPQSMIVATPPPPVVTPARPLAEQAAGLKSRGDDIRPAVREQPVEVRKPVAEVVRPAVREQPVVTTPRLPEAPRPPMNHALENQSPKVEIVRPLTPPATPAKMPVPEAPRPLPRVESTRPAPVSTPPTLQRPAPAATNPLPTVPPASTGAARPVAPAASMPDRTVVPVAANLAAPAADTRVRQALQTLQNSTYPEHREWAAAQLGGSEMRGSGEVVPALVRSAREDKDGMVRSACVRALGKMNANSAAVVAALQMLKSDSDARVRYEADLVLAKFGRGPSGFATQGEPGGR